MRKGAFWSEFGGPARTPEHISPFIAYNLVPANERFFVYVPSGYPGAEANGLIVFIYAYADPSAGLPAGWQSVLDQRKYIFVAAQNAGNVEPHGRRLGLAVMAALKTMKIYHINPERVYAAGFSGGAWMSGLLGFYQSDIFRGTIQNCGDDFYKSVPGVDATSQLDTAGQPYGLLHAADADVHGAKKCSLRPHHRHERLSSWEHTGYLSRRIRSKKVSRPNSLNVPGMEHHICDGETLSRALDFLEGGN